ncbi:MAG: DUF533 domain-containing protein [Rhodobacteraceae bacterium]|nr:DUF533 domain-containing protein [Paracoccaceae bacterium]
MSLMKTLAKVAIGVAVAKGAGHLARRAGGGGSSREAGGGPQSQLDGLLGSLLGGGAGAGTQAQQGGGLGGMLEGLSRSSRPAGAQTDDLSMAGGAMPSGQTGGLDDLLGGLANRAGADSGGLGGLGGLLGAIAGSASGAPAGRGGGFGDMLNTALAGDEQDLHPTADQEAAAGLMIQAMVMAAKSDGKIDAQEQEKLLGHLGDISAEERAFVNEALGKPVDARALARDVPPGLEPQVYAMSVMGIDLDNRNEAQYLHGLAQELQLDAPLVNDIHEQMGAPKLYS